MDKSDTFLVKNYESKKIYYLITLKKIYIANKHIKRQ